MITGSNSFPPAIFFLLSVLPVLATWQAFSGIGWTHGLSGKAVVGVIALIASLLVTVVYQPIRNYLESNDIPDRRRGSTRA
ncbi:MAG TPA: hypothetical protein VIV15_10515 [Anaerolineales bacterium]